MCVGALGRGPRELRGFTEAAGRMFTQRALKVLDEARVICPFPHPQGTSYRWIIPSRGLSLVQDKKVSSLTKEAV